ncbi:hypothetical protein MLD38_028674 [Melastoma candidum]|uniref:Uncharacterized protein n=1 Tax=Melastoma candidum TaxID=119954 RepID=A0ACB9N1S6_9MYRT|nr:hypothetical protein MLD38_028674 [Melastoma candidum]
MGSLHRDPSRRVQILHPNPPDLGIDDRYLNLLLPATYFLRKPSPPDGPKTRTQLHCPRALRQHPERNEQHHLRTRRRENHGPLSPYLHGAPAGHDLPLADWAGALHVDIRYALGGSLGEEEAGRVHCGIHNELLMAAAAALTDREYRLLAYVGQMEFFYDEATEGTRSISSAIFLSEFGVGSWLTTVVVQTVVLMKKNSLEFSDLGVSFLDPVYELFGQKVTLQLVSAVCGGPDNGAQGKVGKPAYQEKWITTASPLMASDSTYKVTFDWDDEIGLPGAMIVRNNHYSEFYFKTITLEDVPGHR